MKVSVITAVRNGATSIAHTLDSVNAQTFPDLEHIIIDGASTDGTTDTVLERGARVAKMISEADSGVYDAFNKGLQASTGDIVGYLNAGDEYSGPEVIGRIAQEFIASEASAVFGDLVIIDQLQRTKVVRRYSSSRFSASRVKFGFMPAHPTLFIRREAYEKWGGYDASYRIAGDFELVARMFVQHRVSYSYIPEVLVRMPQGGLSTSGVRSNWIITKEMRKACATNGIPTNLFRLLLRLPLKLAEVRLF